MTEIWKEAELAPGFDVSNLGRVRTKDRPVVCGQARNFTRTVKGRLLKPHILTNGYVQIQAAGRKKHSAHRLVAMAFVSGFQEGLVVNHKNGNPSDNRAENLEWVTYAENERHSYHVLGKVNSQTGKTSADHPTSKAIIATDLKTGEELEFPCALDAIRAGVGTDSGQISHCCYGRARSHKGYAFRLKDSDPTEGL